MKSLFTALMLSSLAINAALACEPEPMSAVAAKQLVKNAVVYALQNMDPNMDYGKYVASNFVNHVDDNIFNFQQWVHHQKDIKAQVKSMTPTFDLLVAQGNQVAAIYRIHIVKKDGSELDVKDMGFFKIHNHKIVLVDELTRLIRGNPTDRDIGSLK